MSIKVTHIPQNIASPPLNLSISCIFKSIIENNFFIFCSRTVPNYMQKEIVDGSCFTASVNYFVVIQGSHKWCSSGVVIGAKRKISFCHRYYFIFSKILPWQINKTFFIPQILPKSGLIPRFFGICQRPKKFNHRLFPTIFMA